MPGEGAERPQRFSRLTLLDAIFGWLGALVVANLVGALIIGSAGYSGTRQSTWPLWLMLVLLLPSWAAQLGAVLLLSRLRGSGRPAQDVGLGFRPEDTWFGGSAGVITQLVIVPILYLPYTLSGHGGLDKPARDLTDKAHGLTIVLLVLAVAVGAPIVEELVFRGMLMAGAMNTLGPRLGMIASAVIFGLAHFEALQLPALIAFGLVAAWLVRRTQRLGTSMCAHMAFNAVTLVILFAQR